MAAILIVGITSISAQRNCITSNYYNNILKKFPMMSGRYGVLGIPENALNDKEAAEKDIVVPVAVHIVWNTEGEKVKKEMIYRQIEILNRDFASRNTDISKVPDSFKPVLSGNTRITFRLDTITYTETSQIGFDIHISNGDSIVEKNQPIKFTAQGGRDGFPCTRYLNMWVGNIKDGSGTYKFLCGYASFPGGIDKFDGVVINYECFGTPGLQTRYNEGRTVTHEVGHWLNLRHLWGIMDDGICSNADDGVSDTPLQNHSHGGCEISEVGGACAKCPDDEMYMNYMDYVDDPCMIMFTEGQKKRMRNCFAQYPQRAALLKNSVKISDNGFESKTIFNPDVINFLQRNNNGVLEWLESNAGEKYNIIIKDLTTGKTDKLKLIDNNKAAITNLEPGKLYEVVIQVIVDKNKVIEGAPYLFVADNKWQKPDKKKPELHPIQ